MLLISKDHYINFGEVPNYMRVFRYFFEQRTILLFLNRLKSFRMKS